MRKAFTERGCVVMRRPGPGDWNVVRETGYALAEAAVLQELSIYPECAVVKTWRW